MSKQTAEALRKADGYIRRIRNPRKRDYAQRWLEYRLRFADGPPGRGGLSLMAEQAVQHRLEEILGDAFPEG